ncbi:Na+/H+ antiporter NhaC family protein [Leptospira sp. GIMC2001]|uniref:Na+/H+ antiporter NhaC family protein n=1 Tax=Leptospira sp. GIMC2001 TaxID=1513297 RepID=UPI002349CCC0|nr:Na+/H+ antiporter NhaC family protein [Leptospira sp. GIMC2001]WCL50249.1 Na+/H+ antiporter NhaC [Leptospira sp. GIMC2001]
MSLFGAIYPVIFLLIGLGLSLHFGDGNTMNGPSQVLLIVAGLLAISPNICKIYLQKFSLNRNLPFSDNIPNQNSNQLLSSNPNQKTNQLPTLFQNSNLNQSEAKVSLFLRNCWKQIYDNIKNVSIAIKILLLVGALIGSWSMSGILPNLILLGLNTIRPDLFLVGACIASAIISIASGSSWSTAGTVGVALMGVGEVWNFRPELVAGCILSGAYFGDKLSPLSDTTNLASGITKVPLVSHIRFMIPTTLLSLSISLVIYYFLGLDNVSDSKTSLDIRTLLESIYTLNVYSIAVPIGVLVLVMSGISAIPSLFMGIIGGIIIAIAIVSQEYIVIFESLLFGYTSNIGDPKLDSLLSGGGVIAMIPTILIILSAMVFGGCMQASGRMQRIIDEIQKIVHSERALVLSTMGFSLFANLTTSDQYLSIVIPGKTLRDSYDEMGVDRKILARCLEDSGTITSVLIPWNSCGAFMSTSLGIATISYLPFCFFHWIHIVISVGIVVFRKPHRILKSD